MKTLLRLITLSVALCSLLSCSMTEAESSIARFSPLLYTAEGPEYNPETQYRNPILPGFYPDPSICRVGDDYYMVNSSFNYFPSIPVWHSTDLVHWEQLGSVLDTDEKAGLTENFLEWGMYAPQISFNPGNRKFYVVCTQVDGIGNFFCTTDYPQNGNWSMPTRLPEVSGIDPSFFFDEDGSAVICSTTGPEICGGKRNYDGDCAIVMWDFDWQQSCTVGNPHIAAQSGIHPEQKPASFEGPHIYKIDEKYYLLCAEGGTELNHSAVLLESNDLKGTFKPCAINPILTQRDLPAERTDIVSCTGHADLVQTAGGNWYAVFLGCQPYEGQEMFNTGRETFMLPVHFRDGQPVILEQGESVPIVVDMDAEMKSLCYASTVCGFDGFRPGPLWDRNGLKPFALTVRGSQAGNICFDKRGTMEMKCSGIALDSLGKCSMILERITSTIFQAQTVVDFKPSCGSEAGLIAWHDDDHYMKLSKTLDDAGNPVLRLEERVTERQTNLYCMFFNRRPSWIEGTTDVILENADSPVALKLEAVDATTYVFSYAEDARMNMSEKEFDSLDWHQIGAPLDGSMLSTMNCGGFQGAMVGVFTY